MTTKKMQEELTAAINKVFDVAGKLNALGVQADTKFVMQSLESNSDLCKTTASGTPQEIFQMGMVFLKSIRAALPDVHRAIMTHPENIMNPTSPDEVQDMFEKLLSDLGDSPDSASEN